MAKTLYDPNNPEPGMTLNSSGNYVNNPSAITSEVLNNTATPLNLPETNPTYTSPITMNEITTPLQAEQARIAAEKTASGNDISTLMANIGITQGKEAGYATQAGADTAQIEYDKYASDLAAEQRALEIQKRDILKNNPNGALRGGQQDLINNMESASLQKQADIAILGNAAKGRYDTALSIAKRKVDSELAPIQAQLDAKKFIYENNKDLFSNAELSKLNTLIAKDTAKIAETKAEKDKANAMLINALQGKAPQSLITKAQEAINSGKTSTEIAQILGSYAQSPADKLDLQLKQLQIQKAQQDLSPTGGKLTKVTINGVDYMQDEKGNLSTPNLPTSSENKDLPLLLEKGANDIKTIATLQLDNVSIGASAGNFQYGQIPFSKKIQDWQANLGNVLSGLTLAELARVKGTGVTFGALSEGERKAVSEAASALNQAKVMKGKGESAEWNGHFNASEKFVKEKLAEIQSYAELDFKKRTGTSYQDYISRASVDNYLNVVDNALQVTNNPYNQAGYDTN